MRMLVRPLSDRNYVKRVLRRVRVRRVPGHLTSGCELCTAPDTRLLNCVCNAGDRVRAH
jgi:hypothetical protein